jgi:hypothetical protein
MTAILNEIERQRRNEQAKAWDKAEMLLASRVLKWGCDEMNRRQKEPNAFAELQAEPSQVDEMTWKDFVAFAEREGVRSLPAKSHTVAAYILFDGSITHERALDVLGVIARRHDKHGLSNPCATAGVRAILELMFDDLPPPRSWQAEVKQSWAFLPSDIRNEIARIDRSRDVEFSRQRNKTVELQKKLEAEIEAKRNAETKNEKPNGHAGAAHSATAQ